MDQIIQIYTILNAKPTMYAIPIKKKKGKTIKYWFMLSFLQGNFLLQIYTKNKEASTLADNTNSFLQINIKIILVFITACSQGKNTEKYWCTKRLIHGLWNTFQLSILSQLDQNTDTNQCLLPLTERLIFSSSDM